MEGVYKPKYDFASLLATPLEHDGSDSFLSVPGLSMTVSRPGSISTNTATRTSTRDSSMIGGGGGGGGSHFRRGLSINDSFFTPYAAGKEGPGRSSSHSAGMPCTTPATPGLQSAIVVAVVEGRGHARGEIGMASINLKNPVLTLSQFPDTQSYVKVMTKLEVLSPIEVVMPNTVCDGSTTTKLFSIISRQCSNANIATVQRKYFNENKGLQFVRQLVAPEYNSVELEVATKYYSLAAAAALLKYVEFIQNIVYASSSLKIVFKGSENTTMIDISTVKNLELINNIRDPKSLYSLFGVLNHTHTPQGARLLRSNILQPPCNLETINLRQDCIQELMDQKEMLIGIQSVLKRFQDVDHFISLLVQIPKHETVKTAENKITLVIYLKHCLELVDPLCQAISSSTNPLLKTFHELLEDPRFPAMISKIQKTIHEDTHYQKGALNMRAQKCFAVKPNINGYLDVARRTYSETVDDIAEMVTQLSDKHNLPFKTGFNTSRGFYIQLNTGPGADDRSQSVSADGLAPEFLMVTKNKSTINCTTPDLIKMNDRCKESLSEIYLMTNVVISELLESLRTNIGCLYKLSECVSMLDLLTSLAHVCSISSYVRPEFTDTLAIKQGRHPILERLTYEPPVPNNTYASSEGNFVTVTGPNMSGKSTYLKQIALLQIMAQMGCFVPADYASFRLAHQLFSRIGNDDDIETNASTFMVEMREINYILQNVQNDSLAIIDELGRGTSSEEGVGLCFAICEELIKTRAFVFFATHFLELTQLEALYPNVENYCFKPLISEAPGKSAGLSFSHQISKGKACERHYGLQLASVSTLPHSIVSEAKEIAAEIHQQKMINQYQSVQSSSIRKVYKLGTRLVQVARNSQLDDESLRSFLGHLKQQYLQQQREISKE